MNNIKYDTNFSMNDLFCNMLLGFVCLFIFAMMMIVKEQAKQEKSIQPRAEFIITVTWPNDFDDDVDTYVEDPGGNIVGFNRREQGLMHLDRDDFGISNDKIKVDGKEFEVKENRETVTVRGIIPGEYIVNTHIYRRNKGEETQIPITVRLEKIDPYQNVLTETYELKLTGEEHTAFRFYVDENGVVTKTNRLQKRFISKSEGNTEEGN